MPYFLPLRFIGKLEIKTKELEPLLSSITDVYSSGAVEGYTNETLAFKIYLTVPDCKTNTQQISTVRV